VTRLSVRLIYLEHGQDPNSMYLDDAHGGARHEHAELIKDLPPPILLHARQPSQVEVRQLELHGVSGTISIKLVSYTFLVRP
jgi:hypothetical protein